MVVDFSVIKQVVQERVLSRLDHAMSVLDENLCPLTLPLVLDPDQTPVNATPLTVAVLSAGAFVLNFWYVVLGGYLLGVVLLGRAKLSDVTSCKSLESK